MNILVSLYGAACLVKIPNDIRGTAGLNGSKGENLCEILRATLPGIILRLFVLEKIHMLLLESLSCRTIQ